MSEITQTALKRCVSHTLRDAFSQMAQTGVCVRARVCIQIVLTTAGGISTLQLLLCPNRRVEHMAWLWKRRPGNISIMASAPSSVLRRCCRRLRGTRTHSDGVTAMRCKKFSVFFFFNVCSFFFFFTLFPFVSCVVTK